MNKANEGLTGLLGAYGSDNEDESGSGSHEGDISVPFTTSLSKRIASNRYMVFTMAKQSSGNCRHPLKCSCVSLLRSRGAEAGAPAAADVVRISQMVVRMELPCLGRTEQQRWHQSRKQMRRMKVLPSC